ncbi:hypothetical protein LguiA_025944 [Lonicera macranthoides]
MQRWNNKNGSFICLSKLQQGVVRKVIILPAGREGVGWTVVAEAMYCLVFAPSNTFSKQSVEKTKHQKQGRNHGAFVRYSKGNKMTYAEVTGSEPMKSNRMSSPELDNFNHCIIELDGEDEEPDDGKRKKDDLGGGGGGAQVAARKWSRRERQKPELFSKEEIRKEIDSVEITQPGTEAKRNTVLNYEDGEENGYESYEEVREEGENDETNNLAILNPNLLIMNDEEVRAKKMGEDLIDHQFGGELIGEEEISNANDEDEYVTESDDEADEDSIEKVRGLFVENVGPLESNTVHCSIEPEKLPHITDRGVSTVVAPLQAVLSISSPEKIMVQSQNNHNYAGNIIPTPNTLIIHDYIPSNCEMNGGLGENLLNDQRLVPFHGAGCNITHNDENHLCMEFNQNPHNMCPGQGDDQNEGGQHSMENIMGVRE